MRALYQTALGQIDATANRTGAVHAESAWAWRL